MTYASDLQKRRPWVLPRSPFNSGKSAKNGSLGFSVIDTQIWGCERAYARSHPQIWTFSWQVLENPKNAIFLAFELV
jgi:hypothetical protein